MVIADRELKHAAEAAVQAQVGPEALDIAVSVNDGIVMLSGYVQSLRDKFDAEDVVKGLAGVVGMANDIQLIATCAGAVSDPQLARAAVSALRQELPGLWERVRPVVRRRIVTLEGHVELEAERAQAVACVRGLPGLEGIINLICVGTPAPGATAPAALSAGAAAEAPRQGAPQPLPCERRRLAETAPAEGRLLAAGASAAPVSA